MIVFNPLTEQCIYKCRVCSKMHDLRRAFYRASGEKRKNWDAALSDYGVTEADLVAISTYAQQGLSPAFSADVVLAQDEATWPACLLGAVDRTCPVRTVPL
jgi:hypothetical protein